MGINDFFTKKTMPDTMTRNWADYYSAVGKILGDRDTQKLRKDIERWFSDDIISSKFKSKLGAAEHEIAITETLQEQTHILRERLKKVDVKLQACFKDVEAALNDRPTITSPRGLSENELYTLKSDIINFQMCIHQMEQFIETREARIAKRLVWQQWREDFIGDIEVSLRNIEAAALRLQTFVDRHH